MLEASDTRHRVRERRLRGRRHRPQEDLRRRRAVGALPGRLSARDSRAGAGGAGVLRSGELHFPVRRAYRRGRDRPRDRDGRAAELCRGRRRRHGDQSDDRRRPDPRRRRARRGPGAVRGLRLRRGVRPAAVRLVHGLLHAARRQPAEHEGRDPHHRMHAQRARRQGLRRGRHDRLARHRDQRGGRCARASRRDACRHAGIAQPRLAHHPKRRRWPATSTNSRSTA